MNNPFEVIEARLSSIENLILDLKHLPKESAPIKNSEQLLTVQDAAHFFKSYSTHYLQQSK